MNPQSAKVYNIALELSIERERQYALGYGVLHDDQHRLRTLCKAGMSFAAEAAGLSAHAEAMWPWNAAIRARDNLPRRSLVKAGAMIIAAIEWIDRKEARK